MTYSQRVHPEFSEGSDSFGAPVDTSRASSSLEPTDPGPAPVKKIRVPDVFLKATKPAAMPVDVPAAARQVVVMPKSSRAAAATSNSGRGSPSSPDRVGGGGGARRRHSSSPQTNPSISSGNVEPGPRRLQVAGNGPKASSSQRHRGASPRLDKNRDSEGRDGVKVLGIGGTGIVGGRGGVSSSSLRRLISPKVKLTKSSAAWSRGASRTPRKYSAASPTRSSTNGADSASGVRKSRTLFEDRKALGRSGSWYEHHQERASTQKFTATAASMNIGKAAQEFSDDDTSGNSEDYDEEYDDGGASQISASQSEWHSVRLGGDAAAVRHETLYARRKNRDRAAGSSVSRPGSAGGVALEMLVRVGGGDAQRLASGDRAGGGHGLISMSAREIRTSDGASATGGQRQGHGRVRSTSSSYNTADGHDAGSKGSSDKTPGGRPKSGSIAVMIAGFGGALRSAVTGVSGGDGSGYSVGGRSSGHWKVSR